MSNRPFTIEDIIELQTKANLTLYNFIRLLQTIAVGAISIQVALLSHILPNSWPALLIRLSWASLAIGLMCGFLSLYNEWHMKQKLHSEAVARFNKRNSATTTQTQASNVVDIVPPSWFYWSIRGMYFFYSVALTLLTIGGIFLKYS